MKKRNEFYVITAMLVITNLHAEMTISGGESTYTNERGSFTYYDKNGDVLPQGTKLDLDLDGKGGSILNEQGEVIGKSYATKALASAEKERDVLGITHELDDQNNILTFNQEEYDQKSFELTSLLFGAAEVGAKLCKPAGHEMPASLANWWTAIKAYKSGETTRDKILNDRIATLSANLAKMISDKSTKDLQVEAIQTQIDMTNVSIDSIAGTNLFKGDQNNEDTAKTGRLPLREKLLLAALKSMSLNADEHLRFVDTYKNRLLALGLATSSQIAKEACEKTKTEKKCEEEKSDEQCKEEKKSDAVEGCKEAMAQIPVIEAGPGLDYMDLYLLPQAPSKELNEKMGRLESLMKQQMAAIPRSKDSKYDWSTPMEVGLEEMILARKKSGALCPSTVADTDYDRSKLSTVAVVGESVDVPGANKISESANDFLGSLGITGDSAKSASENLIKNWNVSDLVIGQSGNRQEYYKEFAIKLVELIEMDRRKLADLVEQHKKLTSYMKAVRTTFTNTKLPAPSSAAVKQDTNKPALNTEVALNTSSTVSTKPVSVSTNYNNQNMNQEILYTQLANTVTQQANLSKATSGSGSSFNSSTKLASVGLSLGTSLSGKSAAVGKKYLDEIKNSDIKASSSSKALATARSTKYPTTKTTSNQSAAATVSNTPAKSLSSVLEASFGKLAANVEAKEIYKTAALSGIKDLNGNTIEAKSTQAVMEKAQSKVADLIKKEEKKKEVKDKKEKEKEKIAKKRNLKRNKNERATVQVYNATTGTFDEVVVQERGEQATYAETDDEYVDSVSEDARNLSVSIAAKKAKRKDAYDTNEDDSLFTRVTKAYIRNYEKVDKNQD